MSQRIVHNAIETFEAAIKVRELVEQIEAEMQEKIGQISESGMEKLAVKLGEAKLELAQLQLKLVPKYDKRDNYACWQALKHAEQELANLNMYLGFVNRSRNKPSIVMLDAVREAFLVGPDVRTLRQFPSGVGGAVAGGEAVEPVSAAEL